MLVPPGKRLSEQLLKQHLWRALEARCQDLISRSWEYQVFQDPTLVMQAVMAVTTIAQRTRSPAAVWR